MDSTVGHSERILSFKKCVLGLEHFKFQQRADLGSSVHNQETQSTIKGGRDTTSRKTEKNVAATVKQ